MADQLISQLTESENLQDDDLFVVWKDNIQQTRSIRKRNLGISGNAGGNPDRCIVFDFSDSNHKSILIKKGTSFTINYQDIDYVKTWEVDSKINLSNAMTLAASVATTRTGQENGRVFQMYLNTSGDIILSTRLDAPSDIDETYTTENTLWLGYFSTLCVAIPSDQTSILAITRNGYAVGNSLTVKGAYRKNDRYGFHTFYTKTISAIATTTYFDVATVPHTLAGFGAGSILPESIFCLGFMPLAGDIGFEGAQGMVYDIDTDKAIDIYLQSGTGQMTSTVYGATHTNARQQQNHEDDMRCVAKQLLSDDEFTSSATGSNEKTAIQGAIDQTTTGGHNDTAGKRMTSFIGCEEMCGYLSQWLRDVSAITGSATSSNYYGSNYFGQMFASSSALAAGHAWDSNVSSGSRGRNAYHLRNSASNIFGARGCCKIMRK